MSRETTESSTITFVVTGATGRMGRAVIDTAVQREDIASVVGVSRSPPAEEIAGATVRPASELREVLEETDADALVDFTAPESSVTYVRTAGEVGVASVIGTTGFSEDQLDALRNASRSEPVLKAANFAPGVQALFDLVSEAARRLRDYDVEVTETHHNSKVDAPSGTAKTILDRLTDVRGEGEWTYGRRGDSPRETTEIGVYSRRAGDITGENEVLFAANHEVLTIRQRAEDRAVYAAGALQAAVELATRSPGWYEFAEVVSE